MTSLTKELVKRDFGFGSFFTNAMLPNPDKIVNTKGGYEALRRLRNDPHLSSCIQSRKSGLLSMDWNLRRNEADEKMLSEVNKMLKEIDLQQFMRDALDAPLYGFQPIEVIWEERKNSVFHIGMTYEMMKNFDKAVLYYNKVISMQPKDQINKQANKRLTIVKNIQGKK